jgi:hypothetical protein
MRSDLGYGRIKRMTARALMTLISDRVSRETPRSDLPAPSLPVLDGHGILPRDAAADPIVRVPGRDARPVAGRFAEERIVR